MEFHFKSNQTPADKHTHWSIPMSHVQWFVHYLAQVRMEQVRDAFVASGACEDDIHKMSEVFWRRSQELIRAVRNSVGDYPIQAGEYHTP